MSNSNDNNEELLEQSLNQYKEELSIVVSALESNQTNEELIELKDKLIEIIALSEVDLLNVKKTRLLSELNSQQSGYNSAKDVVNTCEPKPSTSSSDDNDINGSIIESLNQLNGKECRVPLSLTNGAIGYHNAIITTDEAIDSIDDNSEVDMNSIKVKVFFTYPMTNSMVPCPHYMSSKCRYSSDKCKYSHGLDTCLADIKPFLEIDYSSISRDSICLAKNKDNGLWHKSVIDDIRSDKIYVKYCENDFIDCLDIEDILPLNDDCLEIDVKSDTNIDLMNSINDDSNEVPVSAWNTSSTPLAQWEEYTKGIGSKLMTKMGYVWGQGLGRNGSGIVEPIEAMVFPTGKSLDSCIEMRDKYLSKNDLKYKLKLKAKQKSFEKSLTNGYNRRKPKETVFDFINDKVFTKKVNSSDCSSSDCKHKTRAEVKTSNTQTLNISLFKVSEDIRKAEFELQRLKQSMVRNESKDRVMFNQLKGKVEKQNQLIKSLKQKESIIQTEMNCRSNKQKLSVF